MATKSKGNNKSSTQSGKFRAVMATKEPSKPKEPAEVVNAEKIAECAYLIWEKKGRPTGQDEEIWLEAEAMLKKTK